jgi:Zn-dependent protease
MQSQAVIGMLEVNIGAVRVRFYFGFFAAVLFYFFFGQADSLGISAALTCCILHELGHLTAMCLLSSPPDKICFYSGGIKIIPSFCGAESRGAQTVILAAGCAVNFLLALISWLLELKFLTEINLALGVFNLMPFAYFDGGRILELYASERVRTAFVILFAILLFGAVAVSQSVNLTLAAVLAFALCSEFFM